MKMKNASITSSGLLMFLNILFLGSCSHPDQKTATDRTDPNTKQASQLSPAANELYVVFFGPWGFVLDNDGNVFALAPSLKGHKNLQTGAEEGSTTLPGGDYTLKVVSQSTTPADTKVNPGGTGRIYTVDISQQQVDSKHERYVSVKLPKPTKIEPIHWEPAQITADAGSTPSPAAQYAVALALTYSVEAPSGKVQLSGPKQWSGTPLSVGGVNLIAIALSPDSANEPESPDAFKKLAGLLGLSRDVQFVDVSKAPPSPKPVSGPATVLQQGGLEGLGGKACKAPQIVARTSVPK
jgi:hypothetical protein